MTAIEIDPKFSDLEKKEWFVAAVAAGLTIPTIGWWSTIPILCSLAWGLDRAKTRVNSPLFRANDYLSGMPMPSIVESNAVIPTKDYSWERDPVLDNPDPEPASEPVIEEVEEVEEIKTLVITDHARRNLALRHGVITDRKHVRFEDLTPFEEEGEDCFTLVFPDINKSKKFAVFLSEDKSVIKTFMPHTDSSRNRAYFKKHANLDSSLKDDMTKDLEFLQKVWLDKLSS